MKREFGVPSDLESAIVSILIELQFYERWEELAPSILELSEHFNLQEGPTPWGEADLQAAYLTYFMPLNSARLQAVYSECKKLNFPIANDIVDIGSGPGTARLNWNLGTPKTWIDWETSKLAIDLADRLDLDQRIPHSSVSNRPAMNGKTVIASYSLLEFAALPQEIFSAESLIIVEPSLQNTSRRLMEFRTTLKKHGFHIWAPCTHQNSCPLLSHSKTDWCHDRIHFLPPTWWDQLKIPMRNETLTYSYLLAAKKPPPAQKLQARVIGDTLFEKGKIRQAVCRSEAREFLAWLKKNGEPAIIPHGSLVEIPQDIELKSNELRPREVLKIL